MVHSGKDWKLLAAFTGSATGKNRGVVGYWVSAAGDVNSAGVPDILTGQFDPTSVRDKVVLIGATAVELGDQVAVPVYAALPGVILQGMAYESIHQGRAGTRLGPLPGLGLALASILLLGSMIATLSWRRGAALVLASLLGLYAISFAIHVQAATMLDVVPPALVLVGLYLIGLVRPRGAADRIRRGAIESERGPPSERSN